MDELSSGKKIELEILDRLFKGKDNSLLASLIATEKIKTDPNYYSDLEWAKRIPDPLKASIKENSYIDIRQLIKFIELVKFEIKNTYENCPNVVFREILSDELKKIQFSLNRLKIQVDIFDLEA